MQAKSTRIFLLTLFIFLFSLQSKATHIVGGEVNYKCLGNDQYEITMTVFRDCYNGVPDFDMPAHLGIFDINNNLATQAGVNGVLDMPFTSKEMIDPELLDPCLVIPPNVCVEVTTYTDTLFLPFLAGGYHLVYQRCCRNMTIVNINNPDASGATYDIYITEEALLECNSSAVFKEWPPTYICVNFPIEIDHAAEDIDGDSIVYRMCDPLLGGFELNCDTTNNTDYPCFHPQQPCGPAPCPPASPSTFEIVDWKAPYNVNDMLGGIPLSIDPQTGFLTGTPNLIGQFVVGICLDEYRDGNIISSTRRDFQYNVGDCGATAAAFFAPDVQCDGFEVDFVNTSSYADEYLWYFDYPNDPSATSTLKDPTWTYPDTGYYTIMLVAEPGNVCTDTILDTIYLQYPTLTADFTYEQVGCTDVLLIEVEDLSYDTFSTVVAWDWKLFSSGGFLIGSSQEQNPTFTVTASSTVTLELVVTAENGCENFLSESFPVEIFESDIIPDEMIVCLGDSVEMNPDPYPNATYEWSPPFGLSDTNVPSPMAFPDSTTLYSVYVLNDFGCEIFDSTLLIVDFDIPFLDGFADRDTIFLGQSVQLNATDDPTYTYSWSPSETLDDPTIFNPVATPPETTDYTVVVTGANGCTNSIILRVVVVDPDCVEPNIFLPNAFTPNNDGENDVLRILGIDIDEMYLTIYDRWGQKVFESDDPAIGWDGTFKGKALPPDVYGFYLQVKCFNGEEFFKKGNIALLK